MAAFLISKNTIVFKYPVIFFIFFRLQDSEKIERPLNWHQRLMSFPKQGILNNLLFKNGFGKTTRLAPVFSFLKKALYLNVGVFCTKILIEGTVFSSPTGDGAAILKRESLPECRAKAVPSFFSYFTTVPEYLSGPRNRTPRSPALKSSRF